MKLIKFWPHLLIIFIATLIRFVALDKVPSALYYDEIDLGYQVRSFLQTGKDYRNNTNPVYFRSFTTDKTPLPILLSTIPSLFFRSPEYQVRASVAIAGVLVVLLSMILAFQLTCSRSASLITGLIFAFSPWQIHFSRIAFEAEFALLFLFLFWVVFNHWLVTKTKLFFYLSALVLGSSVYTYYTFSLLTPLIMVASLFVFRKNFFARGYLQIVSWMAVVLVISSPFVYFTTIKSIDQPRIGQLSIFSDPMVSIAVMRNREIDSGDYQSGEVGNQATFKSKIFFNKLVSYFEKFRDNTLLNFSPQFLFLSGDPNGRHSTKNSGELLFLDIFALISGVYFVVKNLNDKRYQFLLLLLFLGAVPANLTTDGANHASRLITFAGPLLLIVSIGYTQIFLKVKTKSLLLVSLIAVWVFFSLQFLNKYFYHFPVQNYREFGYGFKQVSEKILEYSPNFEKIFITDSNDSPILYYLFWAGVPPKSLQNYGTEFGLNVVKNQPLDKIRSFHFDIPFCNVEAIKALNPNTLYIVSFLNLPLDFRSADKDKIPQGIKLLDTIKYPDNEVAYYILTRDSKNGRVVNPLKDQKCK